MADRLDEEQAFAERFKRAYLGTPAADGAAQERILAAVRARRRPARSARFAAWLEPRTITVRPVAAFAAALALVALGALLARWPAQPAPTTPTPAAIAGARSVRFVLAAPGAHQVALVGDFNGWDATVTPLAPIAAGGEWAVSVALAPGWHSYAFVVDGTVWRHDPSAPLAPPDDFGTPRSVVVVQEGV